jgi:hypothetical protein
LFGRDDERTSALQWAAAAELERLNLDDSVRVEISPSPTPPSAPAVGVVFGSEDARHNHLLDSEIEAAQREGLVVIPVVDDLTRFNELVPPSSSPRNGVEWSGSEPAAKLARTVLEELGIEEPTRRVFISHRRSDALQTAEQLHDALSHRSFDPFIDRFAIRPGAVVQQQIVDAIEDFAFLLLLESPDAHQSEWVLQEVDYALSHTMGLLIVQWPGTVVPLPGTKDLPRTKLGAADFEADGISGEVLTAGAVARILDEVESAHASALVRRRRMLLQSVQDAAAAAGGECVPLVGWRLDVTVGGVRTVVAVAPRPPGAMDLEALDIARKATDSHASALVVHGARSVGPDRARHLEWVINSRNMHLLDNYAIGDHW